ncbi:polysaccharide deacetylase family protein [Terrabacter sp. NPDC000476]|uniref:polysaccharide deacetylase family protein n=1 Tax=Terrabacter sp. NPDC000476 TaxID=3154258 RepID=UPI00333342D2
MRTRTAHLLTALIAAVLAALTLAAPPAGAGAAVGPAGTTGAGGGTTTALAYAGTVYLTFDDGPHATWTPRMLAVLRKYGVHAVFFEVGENVSWYPSITRSLRSYGNLIGNHTWSHPDLTTLSTASVTSQLNRMESALGYRPRCVRPPYGATNSRIATIIANRGQRLILWTVDPRDWSRPGTTTIVSRVLAAVRDGSRILMHDGGGDRSQSVAALDQLVPKLRARGYVIGLMAC